MFIVLDTNVLVSALWLEGSKPSAIVSAAVADYFKVCYDYRILEEYRSVLLRPKFGFDKRRVDWLLDQLTLSGISIVPKPLPDARFVDESDRKFYEVAKFCNATLVTGNIKHYPQDPCISTVADFYRLHLAT